MEQSLGNLCTIQDGGFSTYFFQIAVIQQNQILTFSKRRLQIDFMVKIMFQE
jgi:hypothetical protein